MVQNYSQKQLNTIARENYELLRNYCSILEREGYWEGPRAILKQSVYAILDMYLQTVLIRLSVYCDRFGRDERMFISTLPDINIYDIDPATPVSPRVLSETERFFSSPPVLLQLCGLRDLNRHSGLLGLFFDALLNIQLSLAFLDTVKTGRVAGFIHDYYSRVEAFLGTGSGYGCVISERYIFKKLCTDNFEKCAQNLKEAGENFEYYKEKFLFISDSPRNEAVNRIKSRAVEVEPAKDRESLAVRKIVERDEESGEEDETGRGELDRLLDELNSLVGLEEVKTEVRSLINLIKVRALRKKHDLPVMDMSFHMVFMGNPGTGKTTVARLVSGIYRELGLLSKGTLTETDRSGLVAGYVGQTALKVREVVDRAMGGVLFIDEAYALSNQTANDFGDEAIETLVKLMEDRRDDLIVIVAGYTEEMTAFLKSNPGLNSRFNRFIEFADYSDPELLQILSSMARAAGFEFAPDALEHAGTLLSAMSEEERAKFGNARGIRNMFERIVVNQANRLSGSKDPDVEALTMITADDVR